LFFLDFGILSDYTLSSMIMTIRKQILAILILPVLFAVFPSSARAQLGAIGGVGEGATATPLYTMTGEPLIGEGKGDIAAAYLYTRFTRSFGEKIERSNAVFGAADPNRALEVDQKVYVLAYGVTDRFNLQLLVPFLHLRLKGTNTATGLTEGAEVHGIGNTSVAFKYQFAQSPKLAVQLTWIGASGFEPAFSTDATQLKLDFAGSAHTDLADLHFQAG
jgi:hypothetical protein